MIFETTIIKGVRPPGGDRLNAAKVVYSDGHYEMTGYTEYPAEWNVSKEAVSDCKNMLMEAFQKLQVTEERIFRKHQIDAKGKLPLYMGK